MGEPRRSEPQESDSGDSSTFQTLSQLAARILGQLTVSAWLPAAALVLATTFILQLGSLLDVVPTGLKPGHATYAHAPGAAIGMAFRNIGKTGIGGVVLLVAAVVVLTMLTQAFAFHAIQFLEGYWGTVSSVERLAGTRVRRFRGLCNRKNAKIEKLRYQEWEKLQSKLVAELVASSTKKPPPPLTMKVVEAIGVELIGGTEVMDLSDAESKEVARRLEEIESNSDVERRWLNIERQLEDFPEELKSFMPTRLGNILRRFEDMTERGDVKTMVDRHYHQVPASLRISHDEQRSRLELYCSMVYVIPLLALVAVARFGIHHWHYSVVGAVVAIVGLLFFYHAAIGSARYYGLLLVAIADHLKTMELAQAAAAPYSATE